ncbi:DNA cytosine methyltransferase [Sulfitobacter geojensis]|uniref:DNA (cytosine-5-)-methyltransferase n=1 Tax=Sulfitobacter geojensis TaxID=1342299 RepID=A0AAE2VWM2_9RHOB|nr:DNA cytosine methyltransferase [Sulfitobacter geojensis]MBM1688464.1 DNA cytosine methyltransferase [Sulfitobacter geojensis]MBM1692531.1 DNA cytosine methyltransferase [Sulfitobacter geojensis]MBM1704697.1 DNA cytosine methyltransferase [Sulfitobacter geojensis]MBM1708755.1 DNA cytosine methyltransferase [Sulfitobacter geojensis]MBM1712820.1 DNA cytosine methyltransferase [Sulfitobacter geojensis]
MVGSVENPPKYAEFFCGAGMVRAGLGKAWDCALANDIDAMKCTTYAQNWGAKHLIEGDIAALDVEPLAQPIDLYWASSPCQDFSLAGKGRGLNGARSGMFMEWARLIGQAGARGFAPRIIAFENVTGLMTRNGGRDLRAVLEMLISLGYRVGALEIDAAKFLPQSRPRLFIIGVRQDVLIDGLTTKAASGVFHTDKVTSFVAKLPKKIAQHWVWWHHDAPAPRRTSLRKIVDETPNTAWLADEEVSRLLAMMSEPSQARVLKARATGKTEIGMLYKRGRPDVSGMNRQRAEVRFDGLAGCLRTPAGGSSRQTIMFIKGNETRARLLSSKEVARLMGLSDRFKMPERYNQAYQVAGDGVAVPIVSYLDRSLFQPLLNAALRRDVA